MMDGFKSYWVGETLLKLNEKYEVEPSLAKSYEQIDDTTWKLTLKDHITFSNGNKVTGENVKACLERAFEKTQEQSIILI